ncbi:MAG: hypothetical protein R2705_15035 [Ilumatobacteraceae bacterium]
MGQFDIEIHARLDPAHELGDQPTVDEGRRVGLFQAEQMDVAMVLRQLRQTGATRVALQGALPAGTLRPRQCGVDHHCRSPGVRIASMSKASSSRRAMIASGWRFSIVQARSSVTRKTGTEYH